MMLYHLIILILEIKRRVAKVAKIFKMGFMSSEENQVEEETLKLK